MLPCHLEIVSGDHIAFAQADNILAAAIAYIRAAADGTVSS
jgi:hypothetical protein